MAADKGSNEQDEDGKDLAGLRDAQIQQRNGSHRKNPSRSTVGDEEEDEEEEEPRLKYAPLTRNLTSLYRGGDASSAFFAAGDKMVGRIYPSRWRIG